MKVCVVSMVILLGACERDCPKVPCVEKRTAEVADAAAAPPASKVYKDTLDFVRLGYGDSHDLHARSLDFRTECLSTSLMKEAVRLVPEYNAFDGAKVADGIEKLRGEIMCWEFGREGSPVLYVHFPYWLSQQEKACPGRHDDESAAPCARADDDRRLTDAEYDELAKRTRRLFETLHADEIDFDQIQTRVMRVWWD